LVVAYVLDANALLAYLDDTNSAEKVEELLVLAQKEKAIVLMSAVNWGEAYFIHTRGRGEEASEAMRRLVWRFPLKVVPADAKAAEAASEIKARFKLHYADCFAAALALEHKAIVVTADADYKRLQGQLKILWLTGSKKR
jgi:ribonuclease VapC